MAREARRISKTGMYGIAMRGERLFTSQEDKNVFLAMLEKYFDGGEVYACSLSDTEIRLVVKEAPKGISMTVKPLTTAYARYFNKAYGGGGKLFSGRFLSEPLESEAERDEAVKNINSLFSGTQKPHGDTKTAKKRGDTKTGDTKTPKPVGDTKTKKRSGDTKIGDTKIGDTKIGDTKIGDTKIKKEPPKRGMPSYLL